MHGHAYNISAIVRTVGVNMAFGHSKGEGATELSLNYKENWEATL